MSNLFKKVGSDAGKLFRNAVGSRGIFNKVTTIGRKADNTIQRVGNFLLPLADKVGLSDPLRAGLNKIHGYRQQFNDQVNNVKNGLERAVNLPMGSIQMQNKYT
jgi:hypothetical protein